MLLRNKTGWRRGEPRRLLKNRERDQKKKKIKRLPKKRREKRTRKKKDMKKQRKGLKKNMTGK